MSETKGPADHVWSHIEGQRVALLTTLDGDRMETRPMAPFPDREGGVIRFITRMGSRKVDELGTAGPVNLGYSDAAKGTYLSIVGTARVTQDREKLRELWNPFVQAYLHEGPDGADVALITVEPDEATLWDATSSKVVSVFEHLRAAITGGTPHVGKVEHVKL